MLASPRRPSSTTRIFSSAEKCRRVARRMSWTIRSAGALTGSGFCLIFAPDGYDDPEILRSRIPSICPTGADGGHTGPWEIEWIVLPEIFALTAGALAQGRFVLEGLQVDPVRMRRNLDATKGLVVSEAVMMGLGPVLGRQRAHDLVYDICREVLGSGRPFLDLLAEHPEIAPHMSRAELARLVDPANYLGLCGAMVDRVLAREPQR